MNIYFNIHFEIGYNPEKRDKFYIVFSYLGWIAACCFWIFHASPEYWGQTTLRILQIATPILFSLPLYTLCMSLKHQWYNKNVYILDIFLFLLYLIVVLLVIQGKFYLHSEWLEWLSKTFFSGR